MASPARSRSRTVTLTEPLHVVDAPEESDHTVRFAVSKFLAFIRHLWRDEPTALLEVACWAFVLSWSVSLLLFRTEPLPVSIKAQFERGPYLTMALVGALLSVVQLVAMVSREERPRAWCSFCSAVWLGGLALSLLGADYRVPSGLGYLALALLALLPFWKVRRHRPI